MVNTWLLLLLFEATLISGVGIRQHKFLCYEQFQRQPDVVQMALQLESGECVEDLGFFTYYVILTTFPPSSLISNAEEILYLQNTIVRIPRV